MKQLSRVAENSKLLPGNAARRQPSTFAGRKRLPAPVFPPTTNHRCMSLSTNHSLPRLAGVAIAIEHIGGFLARLAGRFLVKDPKENVPKLIFK